MPGRGTLSSCGGVFNKMAVLHDGTLVPCNLLPTLTMGTIGDIPLQDAWNNHPSINIVRHRNQIPIQSLPGFSDCNYAAFCAGGCAASVMAAFGELNGTDPKVCYLLYKQKDTA